MKTPSLLLLVILPAVSLTLPFASSAVFFALSVVAIARSSFHEGSHADAPVSLPLRAQTDRNAGPARHAHVNHRWYNDC